MIKAKALALPIFRRYWLWTVWETSHPPPITPSSVASAASSTPHHPHQPHGFAASRLWKAGKTLEEKFTNVGIWMNDTFQQRLRSEWGKLEGAREGTLRNWGYRLAQSVLSREDPQETFLKSVPADHADLMVIYPNSFSERLVRRRLRAVTHHGKGRHRLRLLWWSLALVPQLPLALTPLPNITVYYTIYRIWSHSRALSGIKSLEKGFAALDSEQLKTLRDELLRLRAQGVVFPKGSWTDRLVRQEARYLDIFDQLKLLQAQRRLEALYNRRYGVKSTATASSISTSTSLGGGDTTFPTGGSEEDKRVEGTLSAKEVLDAVAHAPHQHYQRDSNLRTMDAAGVVAAAEAEEEMEAEESGTGMHIHFYGSAELDALVAPEERKLVPLTDEVAMKIGRVFEKANLIECVARARRRVVGSMFPAHTEEWPSSSSVDNRHHRQS